MASSLNTAQIIGNLTRDPEVRQTPNGQSVATIGVATNRKWKDKTTGDTKEEVEFHNVVVWGRLAEICQQYLKKGDKVYFKGRLKTRNWEDPDGKKNYRTEIVAEEMIMLGSKGGPSGGSSYSPPAQQQTQQTNPTSAPATEAQQPEKSSAPASGNADQAGGEQEEEIKIDDLPF